MALLGDGGEELSRICRENYEMKIKGERVWVF